MKYFGNKEHLSLEKAPTPLGEKCSWCDEQIAEGDDGFIIPHVGALLVEVSEMPRHQECFLREMIGSLAHQQKRCSCFGGFDEEDSPLVSKRQAAKDAVAYFQRGLNK